MLTEAVIVIEQVREDEMHETVYFPRVGYIPHECLQGKFVAVLSPDEFTAGPYSTLECQDYGDAAIMPGLVDLQVPLKIDLRAFHETYARL